MSNLALTQDLLKDPFKVLFYKALEMHEITCLSDRVEFIDGLTYGLGEVESTAKGQKETGTFCGIASAFSAAAVVGAYALIPFPVNAALSLFSVGCAITGVSESVRRVTVMSPMTEEIERHRLALYSTESINWACLWEYCCSGEGNGDEIFRSVLFKASRGTIQGDRLILFGNAKEPFVAAIKALANKQGRTPDDVAAFVRCIKAAFEQRQVKPAIGNWEANLQLPEVPTMRRDIGSATRFNEPGNGGAIDVPQQQQSTVSPTPVEIPQTMPVMPTPHRQQAPKPVENWVHELAREPKNLFVGAKGGTGKGIFLSNYLRSRKQFQPKLRAFIIDPKNDPKERGYWSEDWIEYRGFNAISMDTDEIVYKLRELFSEYIGLMGNPDEAWLLVCDECLLVTDELSNASDRGTKRLLASQITRVISVGDSFDRNICVVSQSANAGDIGLSAGVLKTLTKVILFRDGDEEALSHLYRHNQIVVEPSKPVLKDVLARSPRGRGAYVSNRFVPMPELPNYSGYDRDKRSMIADSSTPQPKSQPSQMALKIKSELGGGEPKKS